MKKISVVSLALASAALIGCSSSDDNLDNITDMGKDSTAVDQPEEYYAGGKLGTTTTVDALAYQQPTPAVDNAGMGYEFQAGEAFFERDYNTNTSGAFNGLGPVYVRKGCLYCHPAYGHGKRQTRYRANDMGNGYLLVIYDKQTNAYIRSVAGMPQTASVDPFKPQIDEKQITIKWLDYTDEWGNKFPDGETYSLIYPEVTIPAAAYYSPVTVQRNGQNVVISDDQVASEIGVRLESTIGVYGTGLIDAIPEDSITAQWKSESAHATLNPAMWDASTNTWKSYYSTGLDKKSYVRRFTYALSRGPLLDGPGANAIWNITNVTRPKRTYHYLSMDKTIYATTSSEDPEVQAGFESYINSIDPTKKHASWHEGEMEDRIYNYLTATDLDEEMTADSYKQFMIWHRGLAVPAARNVGTDKFKQGKQLFSQIGCASCHRPSWTTGEDNIQDPNGVLTNDDMPRYPNQKIWPYSDFVQHRLYMQNDIRTGWCRTTPLWGRGLSMLCTGAEDRLHDCRARNTLEAIMWHGNAQSDARWTIEKFRNLTKDQREAIIYFVESI